MAPSPTRGVSTLLGTRWRMKLNLGLEPGSYMPQTIPNWGSSGVRVIVNADVRFTEDPINDGAAAEELVGPSESTKVLQCLASGSIVTAAGQQNITFSSTGGWCVQRQLFVPTTEEGALRFWLDCESGLQKSDVTVPAGERLFFTTSCWDDMDGIASLASERTRVEAELEAFEKQPDDKAPRTGLAGVPLLGDVLEFRRSLDAAERKMNLRQRAAYFDARMPALGRSEPPPPALIEEGTLSLKRTRGIGLASKSAYHILGSFTAEALAGDDLSGDGVRSGEHSSLGG